MPISPCRKPQKKRPYGLDEHSVVIDDRASIDSSIPHSHSFKRTTRQSISGRSTANYDRRIHPMDPVVRPGRYRRACGIIPNTSQVERKTITNLPDSDSPSIESHSLASDESSDGDESDQVSSEESLTKVTARRPDPEATRRSVRSSAQDYHNYSAKHHPQDAQLGVKRRKANKPRSRASGSASRLRSPESIENQDQTEDHKEHEDEKDASDIGSNNRVQAGHESPLAQLDLEPDVLPVVLENEPIWFDAREVGSDTESDPSNMIDQMDEILQQSIDMAAAGVVTLGHNDAIDIDGDYQEAVGGILEVESWPPLEYGSDVSDSSDSTLVA